MTSYEMHTNQIKSNNFYWSKNPNKGLSSIQNMTDTTKPTLSTQYLITGACYNFFLSSTDNSKKNIKKIL